MFDPKYAIRHIDISDPSAKLRSFPWLLIAPDIVFRLPGPILPRPHFTCPEERVVDTANVWDGSSFQEIAERNAQFMVVFTDDGFVKKDWHPENLKICQPDEWNTHMIVETVLSMLTLICHLKKLCIVPGITSEPV